VLWFEKNAKQVKMMRCFVKSVCSFDLWKLLLNWFTTFWISIIWLHKFLLRGLRRGVHNFRNDAVMCSCSSMMQRQMIVLAYFGSQCTTFHVAEWPCWFLRPFIWSRVSGLMRFRIKCCANVGKSTTEPLAMITEAFEEASMSRTREVQSQRDWKKTRWVKSKDNSMLIIFFDIKGIVRKSSSGQTSHSVSHTTVTFYGDCMKMCKDFDPNFGDKRTGCCITTTHRLTGEFLTKTTRLSSPRQPYFSLFSRLNIKRRKSAILTQLRRSAK
jgi:hypothetical protein